MSSPLPASLLALAFLAVAACGASSETSPPPTTSGATTTEARPAETPTPSAVVPDSRACNADADCQLVPACDCVQCIASVRMDVEPCPNVCTTPACAGRTARCEQGECVAHADRSE